MFSTRTFMVFLVLGVGLSGGAAEAAVPSAVTVVHAADLDAPSRLSPESVARAFLAADALAVPGMDTAALAEPETIALPSGSLVRFEQRYKGVPVAGRGVAVRLDAHNRVRWASQRPQRMPVGISIVPTLARSEALDAVGGTDGKSQLQIYAPPNQAPRLAYRVDLPTDWSASPPIQLRAYVDAHTGRVIYQRNGLVAARARVYEVDPIQTPNPVDVELVTTDGRLATGSLFIEGGCQFDVAPVCVNDWVTCVAKPNATPDESGDFTSIDPPQDTADEADAFAEVNVYHHLSKVEARMRELGVSSLKASPLPVVVNFKTAEPAMCQDGVAPQAPAYSPMDNAYFDPDVPNLVFGQGAEVDAAYDASIAYHEYGHAVMHTIAPDLGSAFFDEHGLNTAAVGMMEGYADLIALFTNGDPVVGRYSFGADFLRDLEDGMTCPEWINGTLHNDGHIYAAAVQTARAAFAVDDQTAFDRAVLTAARGLGEFSSY